MAVPIIFFSSFGFGCAMLAACAVFLSLKALLHKSRLSNIPAVGISNGKGQRRKEFMSGRARSLYIEGYKKVRQTTYNQ